ncbi:Uma2 family endonuclease [Lusitaniella coriacea LEGE 07157]|uniref:Uma2 family endonuclease n=1 Tax=Lusitaniella coriacea LEGE 07157 TaxID=945747 RepID=A0A8J7IUT7_9CYAN|nr:Uma2 family endonuclease [Lusitaniella coriacea]MBE9117917.1 Uma2 family endonuclease [Lusitaniella coriacea LEGE 07157]
MIQIQPKKLTFEEYLKYEDGTDNRYELIEGELVPLPPESGLNSAIANYLFFVLVSTGIPLPLVHPHSCEVQVPILQPGDAANRYPDLVVLREEHWGLTQTRLTITLDMLPPQLVVEVVSPGKVNRENGYIHKRAQYAARGIPEYWIVDRQERVVVILNLNSESGQYIETEFRERNILNSLAFPNLELTAQQVLNVGES